ncbi:MAG: hypothetical protein HN778_06260 [Prolixibacteraceae bacterium]|jgi:hypothetical protein|nr:hypothetical protein [Prolixibacteraceae bacterium]MBT6998237.1 hypothetical protein [Prolixibacteraceae bacterium]MBT7394418.1 hypothetical protein [Prolixibacteraceae bacterium]
MMKRFKFIGCLIFVSWLLPYFASAQFTETKEISKHFKVTPETRIEISNKYGKVELNTWEKDSVIFEIKIRVEEKKLSKLEKSIEEIDFDFTSSQHFLIVRTEVGQNRSGLEKEILKFKETLLQTDGNIEIDYEVWLPKSNELKVENKFGDIFIGDYLGDVEINLSNGNLKSHNFGGKVDLNLNFADATINKIENGWLDCNYSELYIRKALSLKIQSKSSTFEIIEINELDANSRRDKFRISVAGLVEAKGSFSNFRFNELTDRLTLRADYGDLDIEKISPDFSNIFIESKSTDLNIYFDPGSEFGFEITHTKADIDLCREIEIDEESKLDEKEGKVKLKGKFGGKTENDTKLFINATSGEINILTY